MIPTLLISVFIFMAGIAFLDEKHKGLAAISGVLVIGAISSFPAIHALKGNVFATIINGGPVFGDIPLRMDGLSAWFVLLSNFTILTGVLFGRQYLQKYKGQPANISLHYISYLLNHLSLIGIFIIQNSLAFLCVWELMAVTAFIMVIFEHGKMETLKAGINFLIQSHVCILFLTLGFIWVYVHTGSFDFAAISAYCNRGSNATSLLLFLVFFSGFAIKAGFVPFHTWLPHAHPAAPSHVSGIMSGVLIKTGIYGILRMLMLINDNHLVIGYVILIISFLSGLYGVILATVQHNLKRLLAYHSIENIGIIGMGIGIGAIGVGLSNPYLAFTGFAGALLHTLNHSLFKSLLFYGSGVIYQAVHTLNIERMGGLFKKMPQSALLFLLAALAICGLPPFNGFISEFLIYSGLFRAIGINQASSVVIILAVSSLAMIGGLAILCFTKAFGIVFLGTSRGENPEDIREPKALMLFPQYLAAFLILLIGLAPQLFISVLQKPVALYSGISMTGDFHELIQLMQRISFAVWGLIAVILMIFLLKKRIVGRMNVMTGPTWGCGYSTSSPKLQYTATSYVRTYTKLIKPLVKMNKSGDEVKGIIPVATHTETHFQDKIETGMINWPVRNLRACLGKFNFLQNGRVQFYVLYGVVFIAILIAIPLLIDAVKYLSQLLKQL